MADRTFQESSDAGFATLVEGILIICLAMTPLVHRDVSQR